MANNLFRELLRRVPLKTKLKVAFQMNDIKNWQNGEYKGDKRLIKRNVKDTIKIFKQHLQLINGEQK